MTRPTDASIARAFFEIAHQDGYVREAVLKRAAEFDAESPAGTNEWYCEQHPWALQGHDGCDGAGMLDCARWPMAEHIIRMRDQEIRELHQQYGFLAEQALADPAGTARGSEEVMQVEEGHEPAGLRPVARGEEGKTSPLFVIDDTGKAHPLFQFASKGCWCETCRPQTMAEMRFIVCPDCGNKRCPRANFHGHACTGSNEVGQAGSSWEHVAPIKRTCTRPSCRAEMRPGLRCDNPHCGLKE